MNSHILEHSPMTGFCDQCNEISAPTEEGQTSLDQPNNKSNRSYTDIHVLLKLGYR
jgi:hypothetical protein